MTLSMDEAGKIANICVSTGIAFSFRSVVSLGLLGMVRDKEVPIDDALVGQLNAKGSLAYALGKLMGGVGVDALGGKVSLFAVLVLLCTSFTQMARARGPSTGLTLAFASSRFSTAVVWTAAAISIKGIFRKGTSSDKVQLALSLGQVAMRVGASLGSVVGGILLNRLQSWRQLLIAYAAVGAAAAVAVAVRPEQRCVEGRQASPPEGSQKAAGQNARPHAVSIPSALRIAAAEPKAWLLLGSTMMITPTFDLAGLLPQFLSDTYSMDEIGIGSTSGVFPLAAPPAIIVGSMVMSNLGVRSRASFLFCAQAVSVAAYLALASKPQRRWLTPLLVAISAGCAPTLSCVPPEWITRWGGPRAGLFAGLQDVPGNLMAMMIYARMERLVKKGGWSLVLRLYALQVFLGACCQAGFQALEAANPTTVSPFVQNQDNALASPSS